jgi:hypothetical protein
VLLAGIDLLVVVEELFTALLAVFFTAVDFFVELAFGDVFVAVFFIAGINF